MDTAPLFEYALQRMSPPGRRARLSILIFHRVFAAADPLCPDEPDVGRFAEILIWLKQFFNVLPLGEAVARLKCGTLPARAAAITFDDGYADNLTLAAPLLRQHGLHATFFIATGFVDGGRMWNDTIIEALRRTRKEELDCDFLGLGVLPIASVVQKRFAMMQLLSTVKYRPNDERAEIAARIAEHGDVDPPGDLMLSSAQICVLHSLGMGIGAHTVRHPILATLDERAARWEIADGREFLEGLIGDRVSLFAFPNGRLGSDYMPAHARLVESLGFEAALATNWGASGSGSDCFQLPRFTPWDASRWRFLLRMLANLRKPDAALGSAVSLREGRGVAPANGC